MLPNRTLYSAGLQEVPENLSMVRMKVSNVLITQLLAKTKDLNVISRMFFTGENTSVLRGYLFSRLKALLRDFSLDSRTLTVEPVRHQELPDCYRVSAKNSKSKEVTLEASLSPGTRFGEAATRMEETGELFPANAMDLLGRYNGDLPEGVQERMMAGDVARRLQNELGDERYMLWTETHDVPPVMSGASTKIFDELTAIQEKLEFWQSLPVSRRVLAIRNAVKPNRLHIAVQWLNAPSRLLTLLGRKTLPPNVHVSDTEPDHLEFYTEQDNRLYAVQGYSDDFLESDVDELVAALEGFAEDSESIHAQICAAYHGTDATVKIYSYNKD